MSSSQFEKENNMESTPVNTESTVRVENTLKSAAAVVKKRYSLGTISGINLSFYSADEIRQRAKLVVEEPQTYDERGLVVESGVLDPRMGICNANQTCATCGLDYLNCKGHIGAIELPFPVFHSELIQYTYLIYKHICPECYHVQSLHNYTTLVNINYCKKCKHRLPFIKLENPTTILVDGKTIYAQDVEQLFLKTSVKDLQNLDPMFSNYDPHSGIINVLVVGNVIMRPSLILESNRTSESDLTHKYADIIRTIIKYKKTNAASLLASTKAHFINLLQYHVTTLFNNNTSGIPPAQHRSGKPLVSIVERIKGKGGRFRKHLAGKRVNFAARAVITPSIYIKLDEIGVPRMVAEKINKPDYVTQYNVDIMKTLYDEGKILYVIVEGKKLKVLDINRDTLRTYIVPKTMVYRQLLDGDAILMNRNPTLLPQSMLGFKIKLIDSYTFQIHPAACPGFNADADGDEMNGHILQTEEAEVESELLLNITKNSILLKTGYPILGVTKDIIAGLYVLTRNIEKISAYEASCILTHVNIDKPIPSKDLTGKELFSLILPSDFSVELSVSGLTLKINHGILEEGMLTKQAIGPEGLLNNVIYSQYGEVVFTKFIENMALLGVACVQYYGVNYGIGDLIQLSVAPLEDVESNLKVALKEKERIFMKNLSEQKNNNAYIIADSGASGNKYTLVLTALYTGYQVEGNYTKFSTMNFKNNTLLKQNFINNGLLMGLNSMQYYSAAITARLALIDVFCKTATVGYASRKLLNSLEDYVVKSDKTVRNAANKILYLKYANDGLNRNLINAHYPWVDLSKYYPPSKTNVHVNESEIDAVIDCISSTNIIKERPLLLLRGMTRYLLYNKYDAAKTLLECTHYEEIEDMYSLAVGEPIGLSTGQSFAEPITQLNLNTKHNIGDSTLGSAVDKLLELLYATKSLNFPFVKLVTNIENIDYITKIANSVVEIKIREIAQVKIDPSKLEYTLQFETETLEKFDVNTKLIAELVSTKAKLKHYDLNTIVLELPPSFNEIYSIHQQILDKAIHGIENVRGEQIVKVNTVELILHNITIKSVHKLLKDYNFEYDIRTNQMHSLYKMYGILTVMHYLKKEIKETFYSQGLTILDIHIDFIVNVMTNTGVIKGLSRSGVIADKLSFLAKAGFEIANKIVINSAIKRDTDYLKGLYENTMLSRYIKAGCAGNKLYIRNDGTK